MTWLWWSLYRERMPRGSERAERWARFGRRPARRACPELDRHDAIPVVLVPGDGAPQYHYSSRVVVVGHDWLVTRLAAAIDGGEDRRRVRVRRPRAPAIPAAGRSQP